MEIQLLDRLSALALRRRWMIGLSVDPRCRHLCVALVGTEGVGLSSRGEVLALSRRALSSDITRMYRQLRGGRSRVPIGAGLLAAHLAESQAALLDDFAAQIAPVWDRVLAVAVMDPGLWHCEAALTIHVGLCDTARLAELSGLNVIDAFTDRDLAQDGRGGPLLPIPYWVLLHDQRRTRVLLELGRSARLTYLPASRDAAGAARVACCRLRGFRALPVDSLATTLAGCVATHFPQMPRIDELICGDAASRRPNLLEQLAACLPGINVLKSTALAMPNGGLKAAGAAVLGLLHLDQIPANSTALTGARTPRVLGRLTPGSLANWHRLIRELASARPSVMSLRSAV